MAYPSTNHSPLHSATALPRGRLLRSELLTLLPWEMEMEATQGDGGAVSGAHLAESLAWFFLLEFVGNSWWIPVRVVLALLGSSWLLMVTGSTGNGESPMITFWKPGKPRMETSDFWWISHWLVHQRGRMVTWVDRWSTVNRNVWWYHCWFGTIIGDNGELIGGQTCLMMVNN